MTTERAREELTAPRAAAARPAAAQAAGELAAGARAVPGLALAGLSAVLAVVAFPPFDLWPLVFVAFVPMLVAQHRVLPPRLSSLALGIGVGGLFAGRIFPGMFEAGLPWYYLAWPVYLALLVGALAWRSRAFQERTGYRWFLVSAPVFWVALDFARASGVALLAGTFGNPVYALYEQYWLVQPVSVFGIYGLELLILAINWSLAGLVIAALDAGAESRTADGAGPVFPLRFAARGAAAVAVAAVAWLGLSLALLDSPEPTLRVAAVQPGDVGDAEELRRDIAQTREAAARGAELVVWRERGLPFDPRRTHTAELRALAAETGAHLAIGFGYPSERGRLNEATVLAPDGRFLGVYGKDHPGEFAGDFSDTGGTYPVYDTPLGRLATIICYDLDFTDTARKVARGGAQLIAVPSNDNPAISAHYTHLVFRAIETRAPMIKADSAFDSAIIDPWGRIVARSVTPGGAQATLVGDVAVGEGGSLATRLGDWVGWLCALGALGLLVVSRRARSVPLDRR